jgi:hypothetical protein
MGMLDLGVNYFRALDERPTGIGDNVGSTIVTYYVTECPMHI